MQNKEKNTEKSGRFKLSVRVLALIMSILVAGSALTYIALLLVDLF